MDSQKVDRVKEWKSRLVICATLFIVFETLSGLSIWLLPFSVTMQVAVLVHTVFGILGLVPCAWYLIRHWLLYRDALLNHIKLTGYVGGAFLIACCTSGVVLTWQAIFGTRISWGWDFVHLVTTFAIIAFVIPHVLLVVFKYSGSRNRSLELWAAMKSYLVSAAGGTMALSVIVLLLSYSYEPVRLNHEFEADYSFKYGKDRPFAPSLAQTSTGKPVDPRSLAGSKSCGTSGCHEEIFHEWEASAHRYAAMDVGFQKIQLDMAQQNGAESTRYCGGCHDPISLFSGTKNIFTDVEELTGLDGYQEGVSCMSCHAIRETDIKGNAQYVIVEPPRYIYELEYDQNPSETKRVVRDFLIRSYPRQHVDSLSKRLFKTPEYCAACHKQFIDEEINNVGWVQLQNQYDNWRKSKWNHPSDPERTIECRECHMPLMDSRDPAAGDPADYNRNSKDQKHRSHRFIGANQFMPKLLQLPGWETQVELTEKWLRGEYPIPEIEHKWTRGPAVTLELIAPEEVRPGETAELKAVVTSNKVGHDFPTGPLDIIQAWLEVTVTTNEGREVFSTGRVDSNGFIAPGSFIFKAEPVDQYGNLIDRHNLWEMVGVRHRRALFPGFADVADFTFACPEVAASVFPRSGETTDQKSYSFPVNREARGTLEVDARLNYRKIDQFLLNFVTGKPGALTSPITEMSRDAKTIRISGAGKIPR
jgi:hypothetical protein